MKKKYDKNRYTSQKIKTIANFKNILENMSGEEKKNIKNNPDESNISHNINFINIYDKFEKYNIIKLDKILKCNNIFQYIMFPSLMYLENIELHITNLKYNKIIDIINKIYVIVGEKELYEIKLNEIIFQINNKEENNCIIPFYISFFNNNIPIYLLQYHRLIVKIIFNEKYSEYGEYINFYSKQSFLVKNDDNKNNINDYFIKTENLNNQIGLKTDIKNEYITIKDENKIYLDYSDKIYFTYIYFDKSNININKIRNIKLIFNNIIICKYDNINEINIIKKEKFLKEDNVIPFYYNILNKEDSDCYSKYIIIEFDYDIKKMELKDKINLEKNLENIYTNIIINNFILNYTLLN